MSKCPAEAKHLIKNHSKKERFNQTTKQSYFDVKCLAV